MAVSRSDGQDGAGSVPGSHDHVLRPGRAVHEVPASERALLALDDQQRLAGEHEEVLLVGLPVVHRHRLARPEHEEVDADLPEVRLALERQALPPSLAVTPACLAGIQDEPAFPDRHDPGLGLLERGLGNHRRIIEVATAPHTIADEPPRRSPLPLAGRTCSDRGLGPSDGVRTVRPRGWSRSSLSGSVLAALATLPGSRRPLLLLVVGGLLCSAGAATVTSDGFVIVAAGLIPALAGLVLREIGDTMRLASKARRAERRHVERKRLAQQREYERRREERRAA